MCEASLWSHCGAISIGPWQAGSSGTFIETYRHNAEFSSGRLAKSIALLGMSDLIIMVKKSVPRGFLDSHVRLGADHFGYGDRLSFAYCC